MGDRSDRGDSDSTFPNIQRVCKMTKNFTRGESGVQP